jgi:diguanylate cyclase (GGDEF)-like protein
VSHLLTWLTDNVRNAAAKCGARAASIYVPTPWNDAAPGLLVHIGAEPLPEMADLQRAAAFAEQAEAALSAAGDAPSATTGAATTTAWTLAMRASKSAEGCLIPIPMLAPHWRGASSDRGDTGSASAPQRRLADEHQAPPIVGWLGLRFVEHPDPLYLPGGWQSLLELASALASTYVSFYGILTDPVTGLPGRAELQATLRAELERAQIMSRPVSLLLVQLRELEDVNQIAGRRTGDAVLREFIELLQRILRSSDVVMRYGGAIFALPLRDVAAPGAMVVAEKIYRSLQRHTFVERELKLTCAIGIASMSADDAAPAQQQQQQPMPSLQPLAFLRRADQALAVSCRGADHRPVVWRPDSDLASAEPLDPLLGVFTGQADKDYRNMRLLWEVLEVIGSGDAGDTGAELAEAVVVRVFSLFGAARVALFQPDATDGATATDGAAGGATDALRLIAGRRQRTGEHEPVALATSDLTPDEHELSARAFASGTPQFATMDAAAWDEAPAPLTALAHPLIVEGRRLGALYLASRAAARKLEHGDLPVLTGVATHLALALDRAERAARNRLRAHQEEARLRAEVERLQQAVQHSRMKFQSQAMKSLLDTTNRVAATDATVLVTGESGTGKEMLAHALHSLSPRHDKPLVIVDCGAIPASLMDSELFGRERGAFTGAERRSLGRLAQADGGTVFLDEIGELPLEVQAKLLRFVQERTVTMVGSTTVQAIDVRIIAATNRDLEDDVRSGRFREDLFHRLNVVRLRMPPLRERRDDITLLARHFLDVFAMQYSKSVRAFTPEAEAALYDHDWAGNVRQLQNTILQAVVLAGGERITAEDLRLPSVASLPSASSPTSMSSSSSLSSTRGPHEIHASEPARPRIVMPTDAMAWQALTDSLRAELAATRGQAARPLGKWLGYEVVLQAYELAGGIMARAADRVGLSDTTFVRRLRQAQAETVNIRYPESWSALRASLIDVLRMPARGDGRGEALADRIDELMLTLVVAETPQAARAAALMGLSVPTIKRRISELEPHRVVA